MFKKTITSAVVALGLCLAMTAPTFGGDGYWVAGAVGNWDDGSNWIGGAPPSGVASDFYMENGGTCNFSTDTTIPAINLKVDYVRIEGGSIWNVLPGAKLESDNDKDWKIGEDGGSTGPLDYTGTLNQSW